MRVLVLGALLWACGGRPPPPPVLFRVPTSTFTTDQDIRVDLRALDTDQFRIVLGPQTLVPQLVPRSLVNGTLVLQGKIAGGGSLVLAKVGSNLSGVIRLGARGYEIEPVQGGHRLIPRSFKNPRPLHDPEWDAASAQRGPRPQPKPAVPLSTVTVMFAYTNKVFEKKGKDVAAIQAYIAVAMTQLNNACDAGKVNARFVLATEEPAKTTGDEGGRSVTAIYNALKARTEFLDAHTARENAQADILILLVDRGEGGVGASTVMGEPNTAVGVVDHKDSQYGLAIPHEIGHIMGGIHEDDDSDYPFKYGHGLVSDEGRTIMSNPCTNVNKCILLGQWSSSSPTGHGDETDHDVARVIRETAPAVAEFGETF